MDSFGPLIVLPFICYIIYFMLKKQTEFTSHKKILMILFSVFFFLTEAGRSFYRPFIYENSFFDFYIADTLGSGFGSLTAIFFVLLLQSKKHISDLIYIGVIVTILMLYEMLALPGNTVFDPHDLYATLIAGTLAAVFYYLCFLGKYSKNLNTTD